MVKRVITEPVNPLTNLITDLLTNSGSLSKVIAAQSRIGVPLICGKIILTRCIVQDLYTALGHGSDVLQVLSYILAKFYITENLLLT